jgi:hypothetical protein
VSNYRPVSILNNFFELFEFIIHDHVLHYTKCNPNQHGFTKTTSTVTSLVTFLDFLTPVRGQRQADSILIFQVILTLPLIICSSDSLMLILAGFAVT